MSNGQAYQRTTIEDSPDRSGMLNMSVDTKKDPPHNLHVSVLDASSEVPRKKEEEMEVSGA